MWQRIKRIGPYIHTVYVEFFEEGCTYRAAALAFTSLLSIVPLFALSFTIMSAFPDFRGLAEKLQHYIVQNFVAESAHIIEQQLSVFIERASHLSVHGLVWIIAVALLMVFNMELAFNKIWHVPKRRRGIPAFLMYWAVLTLTPVLIGAGLVISSYVLSLPWIQSTADYIQFDRWLTYAPYSLTWIAFTLLYVTLPNCKVPLRSAIFGALIGTIMFECAKFGFAWYIARISVYELLYGAFATIPIFLVWVYMSWFIVLFGAVISHVGASRSGMMAQEK